MHAFIKSDFWKSERVAELSAEEKLAILWLFTNEDRDICGFCRPSKRVFQFDTGMPFEVLQRACQALPQTVRILEDGTFLIRNFVREQFSKLGVVSEKNNIVRSAVKRTLAMPEALRRAFYDANPELIELRDSLLKTDTPSEALQRDTRPLPRGKEEVKEEEEVNRGDLLQKTAVEIVEAYPRREDTAQCLTIVLGHLRAGEDAEAMLGGTRAIAAAVAQLPSGPMNRYVIGATRFFRDKRWMDDPGTWLRTGGPNGAPTPVDLGGRSRTGTITKVGS